MAEAVPLRIDIVSDVVCPWCIIGLKQVEQALTLVGQDIAAETYWHPFELNPNMPPEGEDTAEHIARKYGSTPEQSRSNRNRLSDIGNNVGFAFNYGDGMRIYNSFNAHKLLTIFGSERGWRAQTALKMALFTAYFQDRRDVSDTDVLCDIAEAQGMDRAVALAWMPRSRPACGPKWRIGPTRISPAFLQSSSTKNIWSPAPKAPTPSPM
jgi:predicted DsbA family dithiol-disulfide isomerase